MQSAIATLTAFQISQYFAAAKCRPTQEECDRFAEHIAGQPTTPSPVQGGSSYTVVAEDLVVQFRAPNAKLDLEFLGHVERAYHGFMPCHSDCGTLGELFVYKMRNVGGASLYLARDSLYGNSCFLLRQTLRDFARFFASAWHNTPKTLPQPDRHLLLRNYTSQLTQLAADLPARFRPILLDCLIPRLPRIITDTNWPLVPNHTDLLENNIHVDPTTGKLTGICDWAGTKISPFGMSLGAVENLLGVPKCNREDGRTVYSHAYHANHGELRGVLYDELYAALGSVVPVSDEDKERIEDARLVGFFMANAWRYDEAGKQLPAGEEDHGLQHLDAVLRATCDGF